MSYERPLRTILRDARVAAGLTQEDVAERLGMSQSAVSTWESGAAVPGRGTIARLADLLPVDRDELLACWLSAEAVVA